MSRVVRTVAAHESIVAMVGEMPPPGSVWKKTERAKWFAALEAICAFVYEDEESTLGKCEQCNGAKQTSDGLNCTACNAMGESL